MNFSFNVSEWAFTFYMIPIITILFAVISSKMFFWLYDKAVCFKSK